MALLRIKVLPNDFPRLLGSITVSITRSLGTRSIKSYSYWTRKFHSYATFVDSVKGPICRYTTLADTVREHHKNCSGCGTLLQSQHQNRRGYIPERLAKLTREPTLEGETEDTTEDERSRNTPICQRCFKLKYYNTALNISIPGDEYLTHLGHLKQKRALILLMVDIIDYPASLFPDLSSIIPSENPVFIVVNKIDLLPDRSAFVRRKLKEYVHSTAENSLTGCNIANTFLVSAKEYIGVQRLAKTVISYWGNRGDVYLLGCTNVGKSTLFNRLLMSLCGAKAGEWNVADKMTAPAATISQWPGTTLDLVSFPLMSVGKRKRLFAQSRRAEKKATAIADETELFTTLPFQQLLDNEEDDLSYVNEEDSQIRDLLNELGIRRRTRSQRVDGLHDSLSASGRKRDKQSIAHPQHRFWLHDTPGAVNDNQLINLLTTKELQLCLPQKPIVPHTFILKPGQSMFLGGLARLDYDQGDVSVYFTVFCSANVPVHTTRVDKADAVYSNNLGTPLLKVPVCDENRPREFPALAPKELIITGVGWKQSAADIVLSSAGWISVTAGVGIRVTIKAFTPSGKGVFVREPLFPGAVNERGRRSQKGNRTAFKGRK